MTTTSENIVRQKKLASTSVVHVEVSKYLQYKNN